MTRPLFALLAALALPAAASAFTAEQLWQAWPQARFVAQPAPCVRPTDLERYLRDLATRHPEGLRLEEVGRSVQGRAIRLLTLGGGEREVLLWSQMHGDEPSATPALLDLVDFLLSRPEDPAAAQILDRLTLRIVPMLNPDGSEVYARRNAQAIDVNRDALSLATPEGRLLKELRDRYRPILGFNLHDQDRRKTVGDSGVLATNAVLAVAGDPEGTITPGRMRAKRASAAMVTALAPFVPGGMARYDEDWSPRAFGDNLTAWGTPVVLLESGGLPAGMGYEDLTRLSFVALLRALEDLARDDLAGHDPALYDGLPRNESDAWVDVALRGGRVWQPGTPRPYRADVAFDVLRDDRAAAGCPGPHRSGSQVVEVGDARFLAAGRDVDAAGELLLPAFGVGVDGWRARRWLDGAALARLARSGVGTVRWAVPRRHLGAALERARQLAAQGRPRIEVVARPAELPWLVLSGPPERSGDATLAGRVEAVAGVRSARELAALPAAAALARLWGVPDPAASWPVVRPGAAASLLRVDPGGDEGEDLDLRRARLVGAWLDGVEVEASGW
ncbi:MAG TPA: M14 family zinc carboxypeptidase [Thermoanaerobaculia bacterium]|nr:M14 family zinc carboxypeptidase [Thermoanaerobaculia bacterium]